MGISYLDWDSSHFGLKVGEFVSETLSEDELNRLEAEALQGQYDLLYLKEATLPKSILSDNRLLADKKVVYSMILACNQYSKDKHVESWLNHELDVRILSLALQSGGHSRYYTDKKMPIHVFLTLYQTWIENSLNGSIATDVLVYREGKEILGLLTYKIKGDKVVIGLVDVDMKVTGKGIGSKLMQSFLSIIPIGTKIEVATQLDNIGACKFYEKNGFSVESVTNIYHIWINNKK